MATPFAFVPRQASRPTKPQQPQVPAVASPASNSDDGDLGASEVAKTVDPDTAKDIAAVILLALSDHRIWSDADLRRKLDICLKHDDASAAGFVPVSYLIRRPPCRGALPTDSTEIDVVKAVRAHASELLEVRMRVPLASSSSSVWYGSGKTSRKRDVGGYEVRRADWATLLDHPLRALGAAHWDERTLYMECVPAAYRSVAGIARFARALVPASALHVQCVTLPPHYLDRPGDVPRCRGYALVAFSTTEQRDALFEQWPWRRQTDALDVGHTPEIKDAHQWGFRTIPKARWAELNEEYLAYRQKLVDRVVEAEERVSRSPDITTGLDDPRQPQDGSVACAPSAVAPPAPQTTPASPYPFGCLVFVRNIHPETNKTTLKALFAKAFEVAGKTSGLDYVDFNKGMDSCHLRLASSSHAAVLTAHFARHRTVQAGGLDDTGRTPGEHEKEIKTETIHGKKEEWYWEKIPEKVRRQAVAKVIQVQKTANLDSERTPFGSSGKKRKR